jgi:HEAT repeat protein
VNTHLPTLLLCQFVWKELDSSQESEIRTHLDECPSCHQEYQRLQKVFQKLEEQVPPPLTSSFLERHPDLLLHPLPPLPPLPYPQASPFSFEKHTWTPLWVFLSSVLLFTGGFLLGWYGTQTPSLLPLSSRVNSSHSSSLWSDPPARYLGNQPYFQLIRIEETQAYFQDENGVISSFSLGKTPYGFSISEIQKEAVSLGESREQAWLVLRPQDFFPRSLFEKRKNSSPEFSRRGTPEELLNDLKQKHTLLDSKEFYQVAQEQLFQTLTEYLSTHPTLPQDFQQLFRHHREEAWWWTQWLESSKKTLSFQDFSYLLSSSAASLAQVIPRLSATKRQALYHELPSLAYSLEVASFLPNSSPFREEWIEFFTSKYTPQEENLYLNTLKHPQESLREWIYESVLRNASKNPELFEKIVTLAIQSPELPLWKKLTQHPQYPLLKEGVSLSLALKASFHFGEPSDLSTLFFLPLPLSSEEEALRHQAIQKIIREHDCSGILMHIIRDPQAKPLTQIAALHHLVDLKPQNLLAFLYELYPAFPSLRFALLKEIHRLEKVKKTAIPFYKEALKDSTSPDLRILGSLGLLQEKREDGIFALHQQLKDQELYVVQNAVATLSLVDPLPLIPEIVDLLQPDQPEKNKMLLSFLARLPQSDPQFLLLSKKLKNSRKPMEEVLDYLVSLPHSEVVEFLHDYILSSQYEAELRKRALRHLSRFSDPVTLRFLQEMARNGKPDFSAVAIESLGILAQKEPSLLTNLRNYLYSNRHSDIRKAAAKALGNTYQKEAIDILIVALGDKNKEPVEDLILEALFQLTAQNFEKQKEWQNWWNKQKNSGFRHWFALALQGSPAQRECAVSFLLQDRPLPQQLLYALFDKQVDIRKRALERLQLDLSKSLENPVSSSLSAYPFEIFLQSAKANPSPQKIQLLQYLSGQSFQEISFFELWWESVKPVL